MVGWSGSGRLEDLERTVVGKLSARAGEVDRIDDTLLVASEDPVEVARRLALLPGVGWIAVGFRFRGGQGYLENLGRLAKRYLSKGKTFKISAKVTRSKQTAGDAVLAGNSELLSLIPGVRVDERKPRVRFRVCLEGARGACGAEVRSGPGGAPSGGDWVSCLVSGGERSSSMAWMAALSGFSLRLVHSTTDEVALRHVARLYSELSHRMDPRCLELLVLGGGGDAAGRIGRWLEGQRGEVFAGMRPGPSGSQAGLAKRFPSLALPLVLVRDDEVATTYRSLGLGRASKGGMRGGFTSKALRAGSPYTERRFGGVEADSNAVIDAMKRRG